MKWLVIIAILAVIIIGMLWLRTVRQGPDTVDSREPHRLDDSIVASGDTDRPVPPGTAAAGTNEPGPHEDLPPSETRPQA